MDCSTVAYPRAHLLNLPQELQDMIYEMAVPESVNCTATVAEQGSFRPLYEQDAPGKPGVSGLLTACRETLVAVAKRVVLDTEWDIVVRDGEGAFVAGLDAHLIAVSKVWVSLAGPSSSASVRPTLHRMTFLYHGDERDVNQAKMLEWARVVHHYGCQYPEEAPTVMKQWADWDIGGEEVRVFSAPCYCLHRGWGMLYMAGSLAGLDWTRCVSTVMLEWAKGEWVDWVY